MQAVGRLGSYISRSVYTVSAPFHPFGGAVDIIVVEQPDGSYKSSPWYVRFGKFQGVLKTKEKVVNISVNGVDADFNMFLDHKGEAFFLKEVDEEGLESACSPPSSSGDDAERQPRDRSLKPISYNCDADCSNSIGNGKNPVTKTNSSRSQVLGMAFGRNSTKEEGNTEAENASAVFRTESLERAEMAANLMDLRWSTNLASPRSKKENASRLSVVDVPKNGVNENLRASFSSCDETGLSSHSSYSSTVEEIKCVTSKYIIETATSVDRVREDSGTSSNTETLVTDEIGLTKSDYHVSAVSIVSEVARSDSQIQESVEKLRCLSDLSKGENAADNIQPSCCSEASDISGRGDQSSFIHEEEMSRRVGAIHDISESIVTQTLVISEEEHLLFGNPDGIGPTGANLLELNHADHEKEADCSVSSEVANGAIECSNEKSGTVFSLDQSIINDYLDEDNLQGRGLRPVSSEACINEISHDNSNGLTRMVRSLPSMGHLSNNLEASELGHSSSSSLYPGVNSGTNNKHESHGVQTMASDVKILKMSEEESANPVNGNPPRPIDSVRGSRRSWFPFKRSRSMKASQVENGSENPNVIESPSNTSDSEKGKDLTKLEVKKKIVKTLIPTPEQLASLNLKEGKNIVIFTFSTAMLGKQQVDARIFRWRWDSRIVISDVDGTITRSDLLGQVMPLVGMDWSHTGVAHLFSAIKENGYELIFLSARSISQSFITRQFLFNIKQDGKALPEGPVVISPDGLFPSLFREVVRRAPHEFKIACLEDIKALFPADSNPFYAGFGNRDTDELSYLKVGIPKGKIFIINPKGEIAVNRRVDTKSYTSLHALVHGMFPIKSVSSSEQEAFNSWNYWKLPPPVDL